MTIYGHHIRDIIWLSYKDYSGYRTGISGYFTRDIVVIIQGICSHHTGNIMVIKQGIW